MGNIKQEWIPITRYKKSLNHKLKPIMVNKKTYRTQEEFEKDYKYDNILEIRKIIYKKEYTGTYVHSNNGRTYTRTIRRKTFNGYKWKVGK